VFVAASAAKHQMSNLIALGMKAFQASSIVLLKEQIALFGSYSRAASHLASALKEKLSSLWFAD
jgi:hypothetical protein